MEAEAEKLKDLMFKDGILGSGKLMLISGKSIQSLANIALCAARIIYVRQTRIRVSDCTLENRNPLFWGIRMFHFCIPLEKLANTPEIRYNIGQNNGDNRLNLVQKATTHCTEHLAHNTNIFHQLCTLIISQIFFFEKHVVRGFGFASLKFRLRSL